jgi:hypothetical protein
MAFFKDSTDKQVQGWVDLFRDRMKAMRKPAKESDRKTWIRAFEMLRKAKGEETVEAVLHWYLDNLMTPGWEFLPQAYTAVHFRQKFDKIQWNMEGDLSVGPQPTERDKAHAELLAIHNVFPVELEAILPYLVCRTRASWGAFCERMEAYRGSARETGFLAHVLQARSPSFVEDWLRFLSSRYGWLSGYGGNVLQLAFRPKSSLFGESVWRLWSREWCGDLNAFDELLEELRR